MEYQSDYIKLALPKGRLLLPTANLLHDINLGFKDYNNNTRQYRLQSDKFPFLSAKIFQEKDIPVQVAIGNYDLGICGLDWIEELLVRYPASALVKISSLGYGKGGIYVTASRDSQIFCLDELLARQNGWRMVSEYPNLAQSFALNLRMKIFKIFPVWGASEVYPPESADLAILWTNNRNKFGAQGLVPLLKLLPATAFLVANKDNLENKDMSQLLDCFSSKFVSCVSRDTEWYRTSFIYTKPRATADNGPITQERVSTSKPKSRAKRINLALPDGHQQTPTLQLLERVGLSFGGYTEKALNRRPSTSLDWLSIKVIRPQDMPLQVANGNFDLAITGRDWLLEHLARFPSSPVKELLDLNFGIVKIVAAVSQDMPVNDINDLRLRVQNGKLTPLRVASEYTNIADKYLRHNHINPYRIIPTWGATEAFLPEDADLLIDNTQTGNTLVQHNLKVLEVLFESTACLIGSKDIFNSYDKKERVEFFIRLFNKGLS